MLNRVVAKLRPRGRRVLRESDDFVIDNARINIADDDVFARDPVNLIRIFRLAQRHGLSFHPDALRRATRSLKLIDSELRENEEANRLFLEILTSKDAAEIVLRRMNETGVLGHFVRAFGRIVAMMQFNMYHHYTVDEHLLRCIGALSEIERGENRDVAFASEGGGASFEKTTLPFIRGLGARLAAWVDHHDHDRHADYVGDPRFVLTTKAEHGACPELVTPEVVRVRKVELVATLRARLKARAKARG